jgi:hypothetical protein
LTDAQRISKGRKETEPKLSVKPYLVVILVLIVVVASTFALNQSLVPNNNVPVPEDGVHIVGEKMNYKQTVMYEIDDGTRSFDYTLAVEVVGFDGEHYTLEHKKWGALYSTLSSSYTTKTDLEGNTIQFEDFPVEPDDPFYLFPVYGTEVPFPNEDVDVGESWQIPIDTEREGVIVDATINYTLSEITTVTVPTGTYEVLKIQAEVPDFVATGIVDSKQTHSESTFSSYILLEKNSHLLIEYNTVQRTTETTAYSTRSGKTTTQMQLTQHTK